MKIFYECQICKHTAKEAPPEWCPICHGHKIIFKRMTMLEWKVV